MVNHSDIRVLVVDDEPAIRTSLVSYLEDYAFQVFSAKSGEQALQILSSVPCQVAIVDLRLPGINGDTMILNATNLYPSLRFLIHTGSVNFQLSADLLAAGIRQENLIVKPQYDLSIFIKAIESLVEEEAG